MRKSEAGFTTVELIVAIQIAFLLAGFVYAVFFFSSKLFGEWREKNELENAAFLCSRRLQQDILDASQILTARERELSLRTMNDQPVTYELEGRHLIRNHLPLLSSEVRVDSLVFRYIKHDTTAGVAQHSSSALKFFIPKHEIEIVQLFLIEYEISLVKGRQRMHVKSSVILRNAGSSVFDFL